MARRSAPTVALAAVALLALTGCTGSPAESTPSGDTAAGSPRAGGDQSVAEACTLVADTLTEATAGLQEIDPADPTAATTTLQSIAAGIGDTVDTVSNADVAALLPDLETAFQAAADSMAALAAGDVTRAAELNTAISDVQASITEFTELCTP